MLKLVRQLVNISSASNLHTSIACLSTPSKSIQLKNQPRSPLQNQVKIVNPLKHEDFFNLKSLVKMEDLFK